MSDRSLDEFLTDATAEDDPDATAEDDPDATAEDDPDATAEDDAHPVTTNHAEATTEADASTVDHVAGAAAVTPTMRWTPEGAPCDACGSVADRRWRDGEAVVCADCKEW